VSDNKLDESIRIHLMFCNDDHCDDQCHIKPNPCDEYAKGYEEAIIKILEFLRGPMTSHGAQTAGAAADAIEANWKSF
jgi:hypothetical protein